jgi:hypothetical protein
VVDKNDRSDTGRIGNGQPRSHVAPVSAGSGGRCELSHRSVVRTVTIPISVHKEKNSPVWKEKGACGIPLKYKRRTLPIERGVDSFPDYELRTGEKSADTCSSFIHKSTKTQE